MVTDYSPLLPGAANHSVTHPEELTLTFVSVQPGFACCVLPGDARSDNGTMLDNGTMVQEGNCLFLNETREIINYLSRMERSCTK